MKFASTLFLAIASASTAQGQDFAGAVYAMSNKFDGNSVVAYGRNDNGRLTLIGEFSTGGNGAAFDGGEGLDPRISANSLHVTESLGDDRFLLAVNAGSNTVSSFRIDRDDWSLQLMSKTQIPSCVGPNSIASYGKLVYVTCIDADGEFTGEPDQEGSVSGFVLKLGKLLPLARSTRLLNNRPSDVHFSPDGRFLLISAINAGSAALPNEDNEEIVLYRVNSQTGMLDQHALASTASTEVDNRENRNLASAIGFAVVEADGQTYVVVSEAREFQANGSPPAFPALQTGSVSTWRLTSNGRRFVPVDIDVFAGDSVTDGQRTSCWLDFSLDQAYFWVANALESTISTYRFNQGSIEVVEQVAAQGAVVPVGLSPQESFARSDGFVDMQRSDDGEYLYQLYGLAGTIGVYKTNNDGSLDIIQEVSGELPVTNTQGLVAI